MRRIISVLMIARLVQRLINGSRRGPGMGSWNQTGHRPRQNPNAGMNDEPPQGGPPPQSGTSDTAEHPDKTEAEARHAERDASDQPPKAP